MQLVFATNNAHKLSEVRAILKGRIEVLSLRDIGCDVDIPETADTLEGNAHLKAAYISAHYGLDCFADDTGLEVEALHGAPGVRSARYAGEGHDSEANMKKLLENLAGNNNRRAQFRTVVSLILHGEEHLFEGKVSGTIRTVRSGAGGFGYDPLFQPDGHDRTFAELTTEEKNRISHRGRAMKALAAWLAKNH
jgi:XTP/dITP diphosphohydrolase